MAKEPLTTDEINAWRVRIDSWDQRECARQLRFAPAGCPVFRSDLPLYEYFDQRFRKLGGMTPEISKEIGWGD
jgi:hypothetical protein